MISKKSIFFLFKRYLTKENPLEHYIHHFLIANIGLYIAYISFGSITIWEVILFLFMAFTPILDNLLYVILHYIDAEVYRYITHLFLVGDYKETLTELHARRLFFIKLILHNFLLYPALWSLLFVFLMFDKPLAFYGLAGVLVHLTQDIVNDEYEFKSYSRWLWPVNFLLNRRA